MSTVGVIGLGKNHERSLGYRIAQELFRKSELALPEQVLVHSRTPSTIDLFFQHGVREVLEQNIGKKEWERRFSYTRHRAICSVEEIVNGTVQRATYEQMAEQAELTVICLEAKLPTVDITPELARRSEIRREVYQANAAEMHKILPYFRNYSGIVLIVTNPPSWHCMDWHEQTSMKPEQIAGIHPETYRLRDFTGLFSYLSHQGVEVKILQGIEQLCVLGDHGGRNMVIPLSGVLVQGNIPPFFRPAQIKQGIVAYVNHLANQVLSTRKTTSHEIAALVSRIVQSYFTNDQEEYVLAVHSTLLGNGKAVFSGEPTVFKDQKIEVKPLDFLNELEKAEYLACLERMHLACERRSALPARKTPLLDAYLERERLFKAPLFLPG